MIDTADHVGQTRRLHECRLRRAAQLNVPEGNPDLFTFYGGVDRVLDGLSGQNVFRLHVINTAEIGRRYQLSVSGIASARIASTPQIEVPAAQEQVVPVRVRIAGGAAAPGSSPLVFRLEALDDPSVTVREKSVFYVPR